MLPWWFMHMHKAQAHTGSTYFTVNGMHRYGLCCAVLCVWHYVIQQRGSSSSKHVMWFPKMCFFKRSMNLSQSTKQYDYAWSILVYSLITDSNCTWSRSSHIARCLFVRSYVRSFALFSSLFASQRFTLNFSKVSFYYVYVCMTSKMLCS